MSNFYFNASTFNMGNLSFLVGTLIQLLLIACHVTDGFKCHQCNSYTDPTCLDKPKPETLKECVVSSSSSENFPTQNITDPDPNCAYSNTTNEVENCRNSTLSTPTSDPVIKFTMCRKIVTQVYGTFVYTQGDTQIKKEHRIPRVTRGCGYEASLKTEPSYENACISRRNGGSHQIICSCDNEEGCNGSDRLGLGFINFVMLFLVLQYQIYEKYLE